MSIRISIRFSYFIHNSELHACDKAAMRDDAVNGQTDQGYNEYVSTQYFHSRISETWLNAFFFIRENTIKKV